MKQDQNRNSLPKPTGQPDNATGCVPDAALRSAAAGLEDRVACSLCGARMYAWEAATHRCAPKDFHIRKDPSAPGYTPSFDRDLPLPNTITFRSAHFEPNQAPDDGGAVSEP